MTQDSRTNLFSLLQRSRVQGLHQDPFVDRRQRTEKSGKEPTRAEKAREEKKETKILPRHHSCGGDQRRESHYGATLCPSIHQQFFQPRKK